VGGRALILLDTHVLLWLDTDDPRLGPAARGIIEASLMREEVAASAISFWEMAMLVAKGRLRIGGTPDDRRRELLGAGVIELPLDGATAIAAGELSGLHGDPADRFIVPTALRTGATLVTADRRILDWPGSLARADALL
jgi:PIN domain nuclease of toxin-antitoxin system